MWLQQGTLYSKLTKATDEERQWLIEYLSFEAKVHRKGQKPRKTCLFSMINNTFPAGFTPLVRSAATEVGFKVSILDNRTPPVEVDDQADLGWLRDYQLDSVKAILKHKRGILWLPTGCLAGDTKLVINRGGNARTYELATVVRRLAGEATVNRAGRSCAWDLSIPTYTQSVDANGFIRKNQIVRGWRNGVAKVFEVVTEGGRVIRATSEHRFLIPGADQEFVPLRSLKVGTKIMVTVWPQSSGVKRRGADYVQIGNMRHHPFAQISNTTRDGRVIRVPLHRLVAEARENDISLNELVGRLVLGDTTSLVFLDPDAWHVHHKDEDVRNNDPSNLEVLSASEHLTLHGKKDGWKHVAGQVTPERVRSIRTVGEEETYDLQLADPMNNYVANEIAVHNSGKTECMVALTLTIPGTWLAIVHRSQLADDIAARYEKRRPGLFAGRILEGRWEVHDDSQLVCATYQSINAALKRGVEKGLKDERYVRVRKLLETSQGVMCDECFPAGTMVGSKPIEQVRVGDVVPSYDEREDRFVERRVLKVFKSPPRVMVRVHFDDGQALVCTEWHPFYTLEGWVPARLLEGCSVLSVADDTSHMSHLQDPIRADEGSEANESSALLPNMRERASVASDGEAQPNEAAGSASQGRNRKAGAGGLGTSDTWGERYGADRSAEASACNARQWLGDGIPDQPGPEARGVPDGVQGRSGAPTIEDGCGGGRRNAQVEVGPRARHEEGSRAHWTRVARVEVLQPGDLEERGGVCPDGQVYNLHVEGTETYVAEGRVVHNCHTAPADSFYRVIMQMKNAYYRVGLSGTPLARGDEKSLYAIAAIGKVVHRVRTQLLIERGVLAKPTVRMITVTTPSIRPTWQGVEGECIVRNTRRNLALASIAKRATKPAFLFVSQIAHGKNLAKMLINAGISAEFVWGNHSVEYRKSLIRRMVQGHFEVLVCSSVFNEGIDCLDAETEVLTPRGWRGMNDVAVGDLVYSMNTKTERLEATPATRVVTRSLKPGERMVSLRSQHLNIRVSEGHEFHFKYHDPRKQGQLSDTWQRMTGAQLVARKGSYALPLAGEASFPGVPLTDDELRFVAWFMTDGGFVRTSVTAQEVSICQSKKYHVEIRTLLRRLGLDFRERLRQPGRTSYANSKPAYVFNVPQGTHKGMPRNGWRAKFGAYLDKNVSPLLHAMTREQFAVFWKELLKGDGGNFDKGKSGALWCDRKEQADAYAHLAVTRGFAASYTEAKTKSGRAVYMVRVRDTRWITPAPNDSRSTRAVFEEPRPGEIVWCVTNQNSTLVTRRHGKIAIVGNCPELRATINGGGGKSVIATYQRLGRGMRVERKTDGTVAEGGDQFEVWDILDKGNKWTERHAQARQSAYAAEGYATFVEPEFQAPKSGRVSAQIIQSGGAGDAFPHKAKALLVSPSGVSDEGLEVLKRIHVTPKAGGAPEGRQRT